MKKGLFLRMNWKENWGMFDSREDFMRKLFGIETTSENVLDDWKE